jgi:hypothetical protein
MPLIIHAPEAPRLQVAVQQLLLHSGSARNLIMTCEGVVELRAAPLPGRTLGRLVRVGKTTFVATIDTTKIALRGDCIEVIVAHELAHVVEPNEDECMLFERYVRRELGLTPSFTWVPRVRP